jgi:hypothetical protein
MRTVERFAFIFGIANLVLGALALFSPFVKQQNKLSFASRLTGGRLGRTHSRGIINKGTGQLFGFLGAVNPPHAMVHSALGAAGLATKPFSRFSRAYMWLNAALFLGMAAIGWATVGFKPGTKKVMGYAVDLRDNIISTLWGAGALLLAIKPNLGRKIDDLNPQI